MVPVDDGRGLPGPGGEDRRGVTGLADSALVDRPRPELDLVALLETRGRVEPLGTVRLTDLFPIAVGGTVALAPLQRVKKNTQHFITVIFPLSLFRT